MRSFKRWAPPAASALFALLVLAAAVRAWMKFGGEAAAEVLVFGLIFGVVLWRVWRYARAILFGGRSQFSR